MPSTNESDPFCQKWGCFQEYTLWVIISGEIPLFMADKVKKELSILQYGQKRTVWSVERLFIFGAEDA